MRAVLAAALLTSAISLAQPAPEVIDAGVPEAIATPPLPAPVPAPPAEVDKPFWEAIRIYGTFKPTLIFSADAVESFSQPNGTAITAAANPMLATSPSGERLTFQVGQSRLGFQFNEKGAIRAQLELDFLDFSKASPTVASVPRLRLARFDWVAAPWVTLSAGQDWDLHAPMNPHGSNMVGAHFLSGNSGFMRQAGEGLLHPGAAGAGGRPRAGRPQRHREGRRHRAGPLAHLRAARHLEPEGRHARGTVGHRQLADLLRRHARRASRAGCRRGALRRVTLGTLNARVEVYLGRNAANLGLLTLGLGGAAADVDEWGGFFSLRYGLTAHHFLYGHAGIARALAMAAVRPSYGTPAGTTTLALAGTGPGIRSNAAATLGYELRISKMLAFLLEGFYFRTEHALTDADREVTEPVRTALGAGSSPRSSPSEIGASTPLGVNGTG